MSLDIINQRGLVLLGCGKMGSAMLEGWLARGVAPSSVSIIDPYPSARLESLAEQGLQLNAALPDNPAICILAVKPQMMQDALPQISDIARGGTIFLSIAAGTSIGYFESVLGRKAAIVRAMPNTPAAVGRGITAIVGNGAAGADALDLADELLQAVGQTVRLQGEDQMDAVTAVSGSGPAYVFHMIEALAAAGVAEGLPADLAMQLAKATVGGAGALAEEATEMPDALRVNVTSKGGTTAAALDVLMNDATGLAPLMRRAVKAAADRSRELGE
ncbi:pyrroline-5-carboxylate reductase [Monaibacterium marinum]|uniref:Pyrroline-5-carboxylate reductase n=1 Tax=Pontivivens marinum TaxID=1690039 RepID=A0A2C9CSE8_9RHOB|nr:pyrroline-5-carboxylate reductase [Monaibacterium marinum]SOH94172.1 pyrroline-5-carboxylate reductase [Monaibacterium marinum]